MIVRLVKFFFGRYTKPPSRREKIESDRIELDERYQRLYRRVHGMQAKVQIIRNEAWHDDGGGE